MSFKIDTSKFKKIAHDKDTITMQHEDGHMLKIATKPLASHIQEQLKKLPLHESNNPKLAESKKVPPKTQMLAEGTPDAPLEASPPESFAHKAGSAIRGAVGDAADAFSTVAKPVYDTALSATQGLLGTPDGFDPSAVQSRTAETPPPMSPEMQQLTQQVGQASAPVSLSDEGRAPSSEQQPQAVSSGAPDIAHGYQTALKGINQGAVAEGALGDAQAKIYDKNIIAQEATKNQIQSNLNDFNKEFGDAVKDLKDTKIDSNHYLNSLGTPGKISTTIGLILGGFGSGLTGQPNAALGLLQKHIDNDVEAQRADLGRKQNLLSANIQHFNSVQDGIKATQLQQTAIVADQLRQEAAKATNPMAKANALKAAGDLEAARAPEYINLANRQALIRSMNDAGGNNVEQTMNYARVLNPELAKDLESRYVPHVGLATVPVPAEARNTMVAKQELGQALTDLQDWASKHSGSLDPSAINEGKAKAANVQNLYRAGINGGVFKKGEQSFIDNIVDSDQTKFFNNIRTLPQLKAVKESNDQQLNTLKSSFGLKSTPSAPQAEIRYKNGVPFQKVPGGWAPIKQ